MGIGFCARCGGEREEVPVLSVIDVYTREYLALEVDSAGSDALRQRAGVYVAAFSGVGNGTEDRVGAH